MSVRSLRAFAAAATIVAAGALVPLALVPASAAPSPRAAVPQSCRIATDTDLRATGRLTPGGWYQHEQWAAGPAGQRSIRAVERALATELRLADVGSDAALDAGLIGVALDHHNRTVVVVVDQSRIDGRHLEQRLKAAAATAATPPIAVRVGRSCNLAHRLADARALLRARAWHTGAAATAFGYTLDANDSTWHVSFGAADATVADALAKRLGKRGTVDALGTPQRRDRMTDGTPHYGGSAIGPNTTTRDCSSGFTVVTSSGVRGITTAGHCYGNGTSVYSGSSYYGVVSGNSGFPTYDMELITGSTYANKIHVDPCCPDVRTVTGRGDPALNTYVCASGMMTKAVCGILVTSTNASFCDSSGCTPNLIYAQKTGVTVGQGGDSGAPVYTSPDSTSATVRGMEIAGTAYDNLYAHKVSTVESHLGVTVATS